MPSTLRSRPFGIPLGPAAMRGGSREERLLRCIRFQVGRNRMEAFVNSRAEDDAISGTPKCGRTCSPADRIFDEQEEALC